MSDWQTDSGAASGAQNNEWHAANGSNGTEDRDLEKLAANVETLDVNDDPTAPTGPMDPEEQAAFRARAAEAGWASTVPANNNIVQSRDDPYAAFAEECAVYVWNDEFGDVFPEDAKLEENLFGGEFRMRQGRHLDNLIYPVTVEGPEKIAPIRSFDSAGLHPILQDTVVNKCGYQQPTSIQAYTIPAALLGKDLVATSHTGSGKTAAYLIPVISRLMGKADDLCAPRPKQGQRVKAEPLVVIIVPTRELAYQVFDECRRLCYRSKLRPATIMGGQPYKITFEQLEKGCDILVATPGRLVDVMKKPDLISMSRIMYTIIDEADDMVNADWEEELNFILAGADTNDDADHLYMMFSATFGKEMRALARKYMAEDHYRLTVGRAGSVHKNIAQDIIFVDGNKKYEACFDLLYSGDPVRTLIFCNSKMTVDALDAYLYLRQLPTTSIHSDRAQREREDSMRAFRNGGAPILIASGIFARGIDVAGIEHVINFDLPSVAHGGIQEYVHRIGRTARIGHKGKATSFYNERRDEDIAQSLVNILLESGNEVPDFLSHLVPEDGVVDFNDDQSDDEDEQAGNGFDGGSGGGFGNSEEGAGAAATFTAAAWGATPATESQGFSAESKDSFTATDATSAW